MDCRGPFRCALMFAAAAAALGALSGCAVVSDDTLTRALAAPDKFNLYTCKDLETRVRLVSQRERELAKEMDTASRAAGGAIINTIAYRNEYLQVKADLVSLADAAAKKNCTEQSGWTSQKSVF